ncbi:MAG: hypothetical protein LBQ42_09510 [Synergistaceae bacterium]|nr:hypothetical protein [Synergistaceae bacterium]
MKKLYEQIDFILSGGALKLLVDFLTPRVEAALIVSPKGADLEIVDAVGIRTEDLFLRGQASKLASVFAEHPLTGKFSVNYGATEGEWPWAVRIHGMSWSFYILLRESPQALLPELQPLGGLISLWQTFQNISVTEERLSRLSYMILATKNTLASIFEPMPLDYYAAFLTDVLRESLFPRSLSIFQDNGAALLFLEGDERTPPAREGLYLQTMWPPTPIVTRQDAVPYEVVLPIMEPYKLFCVSEWDKLPTEETLNFLELVGNLASRSLSINYLRTENLAEKGKTTWDDFTILSLAEALGTLKKQKTRADFLSLAADIFSELVQESDCFLVVWDKGLQGYVPAEYRKNGLRSSFEPAPLASALIVSETERPFFDLRKTDIAESLECPWPEMNSMRYVFPFWSHGRLEGFIALSAKTDSLAGDSAKLSALRVIAQFVAFDLEKFMG